MKNKIFIKDIHFFFSKLEESDNTVNVRELQYLNDSLFLYDNYDFSAEILFFYLVAVENYYPYLWKVKP